MICLKEYSNWIDKSIMVTCKDGQCLKGQWIDWTSALDNEPDPESITIQMWHGGLTEIFVHEIKTIELAE